MLLTKFMQLKRAQVKTIEYNYLIEVIYMCELGVSRYEKALWFYYWKKKTSSSHIVKRPII